ncbi:Gfo/Idh/MocA family protein [Arthrobacter crystallopoietes]|uniref:Predicted dehydrogenase n=1 Tax=Crystallibacter crystallopoietes TaxID=37928 RepID=A0A1H1FIB0_9MICC|nr:Gfo/Idh/MocA family oxidoreductase [Arthrobacter crystallopoietes]AUI49460.1 dehydrogenase [Arthrobacter crystallopoietes]SDR00538.1 Predicted dehydrogenase [Arthrobacter crystallopoietes]
MAKLRAGLIGLGMMGRHHARVLGETDGVELVAVADAYGDPHGVASDVPLRNTVEELIAHGLDMVVCAVPTGLHEEVGLALAEAGIHTLIEKPIAATVDGGLRLAEAFEAKGLVGAVGHIERYNPALQSLRARLENGDLGTVYQIATRRQGPFPARIADVGVIKDLGTHDIDLTAWLAQSDYQSVSARATTRSGREHEDMVAATGQLANGIITSHLVNWLSPMKERVTVVTGERGSFLADTLTADLTFYENGTISTQWDSVANFRGVSEGNVTRLAIPKREPLKVEHEAFRDAVLAARGESATAPETSAAQIVTMREGLNTLRVAEAMVDSSREARTIRLQD